MSSRVLAGSLGLRGDWDEGEDGWKAEMDDNLLWLSVLTQGRFVDVVSVLPGSPAQGVVYILSSGAASHANEIAAYDEGAWHYHAPVAGWRLYNTTLGVFFQFGTAWVADTAALTAEDIRDVIGAALVSGSNVTVTPNDGADTITISASAGLSNEQIQDMIASFLVQGSNITLTYNDAGDTLTIAAAAASASAPTVVQAKAKADCTGSAGSITLDAAPTAGNLLIAIGGDWQGTNRTDGAGWNRMAVNQATQSTDTGFIYWKVAATGESATQTVFTNVSQHEMVMFEIAGSDPAHFVNQYVRFSIAAATALGQNVGVPAANCLCIGAFQNQGSATNPALTLGGTLTQAAVAVDATVGGSQGPRQIVGVRETKNKGGWDMTATLAAARTNGYGFVVLAPA